MKIKAKTFEEYMKIGMKEARPEMIIKGGHLESPAWIWWKTELKRLARRKVLC